MICNACVFIIDEDINDTYAIQKFTRFHLVEM